MSNPVLLFVTGKVVCPPHRFWTGMVTNFLSLLMEIPELFYSSVTELLILAHNCFSLTCHMEGITRVLQAARLLTDEHLAPNEEYGLMVRVFDATCVYPDTV